MGILELSVIIIIGGLISGFVIWIVSKLGLGLKVDGFLSAFIAAIIIAMVGGLVNWLLGILGLSIGVGWIGAVYYFIIAAIVLLITSRLIEGFQVAGFIGALIASLAIAVVHFLLGWLIVVLLG